MVERQSQEKNGVTAATSWILRARSAGTCIMSIIPFISKGARKKCQSFLSYQWGRSKLSCFVLWWLGYNGHHCGPPAEDAIDWTLMRECPLKNPESIQLSFFTFLVDMNGGQAAASAQLAGPAPLASEASQRGTAAPEVPRAFCHNILTVLIDLPDERPLVKLISAYYVFWRFLHFSEHLHAFYETSDKCR